MASSDHDGTVAGEDLEATMERRSFLSKIWAAATALVAGAGAWTTWDLMRPLPASGFGGVVRGARVEQIPDGGVLEIPAARAYLTKVGDEVVALSRKCTHLGCGVPYCDSSGRFECPCHGSYFSRGGDYLAGPAPRGMDEYPVEIIDGLVNIDTGTLVEGPTAGGSMRVDEPPRGPACAEGGH